MCKGPAVDNTDTNSRETKGMIRMVGVDMEACFAEMSSYCIIYITIKCAHGSVLFEPDGGDKCLHETEEQ